MINASDHRRVKAAEGINENTRLRACASWTGSMRIFHSKAWLERERVILKYPASIFVKMGDKEDKEDWICIIDLGFDWAFVIRSSIGSTIWDCDGFSPSLSLVCAI